MWRAGRKDSSGKPDQGHHHSNQHVQYSMSSTYCMSSTAWRDRRTDRRPARRIKKRPMLPCHVFSRADRLLPDRRDTDRLSQGSERSNLNSMVSRVGVRRVVRYSAVGEAKASDVTAWLTWVCIEALVLVINNMKTVKVDVSSSGESI